MAPDSTSDDFYRTAPTFRDFRLVADEFSFSPLPEDWLIGVADVEQSTKAIQDKRYKAVNMAGAAVIAAVANALGGRDFPFVFGGDRASFAVSPANAGIARQALAETATWVREDLDLTLRVGMVTVGEIRRNGHDVRVGRYAVSDNISIAMFSGGGVAWADAAMKRDEISVPPAPAGARPDLSGLSCRFEQFPTQYGQILSVLVLPADASRMSAFRAVVKQIISMVEGSSECARPAARGAMQLKWPPQGFDLEALASRKAGEPLGISKLKVYARTFLYFLIMHFNLRVGRFIPRKYLSEVAANSDFRKFDDALRMIVDCSPGMAQKIEGWTHPLRLSPRRCRHHDLLRAFAVAANPRPFHRRCPGRLRPCGLGPQAAALAAVEAEEISQ
jgi:hypothetical protein